MIFQERSLVVELTIGAEGLWNDKVISHTLDGDLIVTNKTTGAIEQEVQLADASVAEVITAARSC